MHTITIQIDRTGTSHNHELSPDTKYIASCENQPTVDLSIDCDQSTFNAYKEMLRYEMVEEASRKKAISFFETLITKLFDDIKPLCIEGNKNSSDPWLHLRLTTNEKELVQLPFELALTPNGFQGQHSKPFLLNPQRLTTLTREVKQVGSPSYQWPVIPRILFAWAKPNDDVPYKEHFNALRDIVKQLVCPIKENAEPVYDISQMITVVERASLRSINLAIKEAINKEKPFTHIHLLVHGSKKTDNGFDDFKLLLHDNDNENQAYYAEGDELILALSETDKDTPSFPAVVSMMTCDSGNTGNISMPAGSLAHQLHESGFPCVFASQFPLSIPGSVKLVSELYSRLLLEGEDPRKTLYHVRKEIFDKKIHDWASLIAHVRFPNNIDEQLKDYRLKLLLESLKTNNAWAEHLLKYKNDIAPEVLNKFLDDISQRLDTSINYESQLCKQVTSLEANPDRYAEHCGLLGSANKRKAEHLFRLSGLRSDLKKELIEKSYETLIIARDWYQFGFTEQRKNHWTGIQYLSLAAITNETLNDDEKKEMWGLLKIMANDDVKQTTDIMKRIWAWGTLMELYLLKPLACSEEDIDKESITALQQAKAFVTNISKATATFIGDKNVKTDEILFAQDSTAKQLERYIIWWPKMIVTPITEKLKNWAKEVREILPGTDWKNSI